MRFKQAAHPRFYARIAVNSEVRLSPSSASGAKCTTREIGATKAKKLHLRDVPDSNATKRRASQANTNGAEPAHLVPHDSFRDGAARRISGLKSPSHREEPHKEPRHIVVVGEPREWHRRCQRGNRYARSMPEACPILIVSHHHRKGASTRRPFREYSIQDRT